MNNIGNTLAYCWYYATREEALNWPIAPGNMLVFKDPDGKHFYTKSLGWSPYEGIKFEDFSLVENKPVEVVKEEPVVREVVPSKTERDIEDLKEQMAALMDMMKNKQQYYNKKGDGKQ